MVVQVNNTDDGRVIDHSYLGILLYIFTETIVMTYSHSIICVKQFIITIEITYIYTLINSIIRERYQQ